MPNVGIAPAMAVAFSFGKQGGFMSKGGSQLSDCQIAQSWDSFCDFGRKLENLSMPVNA